MKKIVVMVIMILLAACNTTQIKLPEHEEEQNLEQNQLQSNKDITIGYQNYPSSLAQTYLVKNILENKGYDVGFKEVTRDNMFEIIKEEGIDVTLGCWLPDLDQDRMKEYEGFIEDIGVNYASSELQLFVPTYTHIAATEELKFYESKLNKTIYVLEQNDILKDQLEQWIEGKGYDFNIISLKTAELDQIIEKSIEEKIWFVFAGWTPHYLLGKYDLRALEGEKIFAQYPQQMHTVMGKNYEDKQIIELLGRVYLEPWEMNELIYLLKASDKALYDEVIKKWIEENPNLIKKFYSTN
jgi:glycine betaine/proline transport system substrate-binding protein